MDKQHSLAVTRDIENIGAVFPRSRNMLGMNTHANTTPTSAASMATEDTQLGN